MYLDQIGNEEHSYRLRFSDGSFHVGTTPSGAHLAMMFLFFERHVTEEDFADDLREQSRNTGIPIDELIDDAIDQHATMDEKPDGYYQALLDRDEFLMWLHAREALFRHDDAKRPKGMA